MSAQMINGKQRQIMKGENVLDIVAMICVMIGSKE
jgi:hypothetical protein